MNDKNAKCKMTPVVKTFGLTTGQAIQNLKLNEVLIKISISLIVSIILVLFLMNTEKLDLDDYFGMPIFLIIPTSLVTIIINFVLFAIFSTIFYFLRINYNLKLLLKNLVISIIITSLGPLSLLLVFKEDCIGEAALGCGFISLIALLLALVFILIFTIFNMFKLRKSLKNQEKLEKL